MKEILERISNLENSPNKITPALFKQTEAALYLSISIQWLKFLVEKQLIPVVFLPGYLKPKFYKKHLDEFIVNIYENKNSYSDLFIEANEILDNKYGQLNNRKH